jgi:hypothetical protein
LCFVGCLAQEPDPVAELLQACGGFGSGGTMQPLVFVAVDHGGESLAAGESLFLLGFGSESGTGGNRGNDRIDLTLGDNPVRRPPRLAQLVLELADSPRDRSAVGRVGATQFLFPGRVPGRPAHAAAFANKLNLHDIKITAVRNTARITLALDLPAAVLADLFDMHINTAVRWVQRAKRDWSSYIATRAEDLNHKGRPQRWNR